MICLIDGNNFFVSCERVFDASLHKKPVIVLSNNDGCVISRSNEAKTLGIKMGQPAFEIKSIIEKENIKVFSSNFKLYGDMSTRMMNVLAEFSPNVEIYSIDEAFCDLSFVPKSELNQYGRDIRNKIKKYTGLPCGIGISYTKVLAKIANRIAKKSNKANGVLALIEDAHIDRALDMTKIEDIWGIGKQYTKLLNANHIYTAKEFRDSSEKWVQKHMSIVGLNIQQELKKQSCLDLEIFSQPKKSITVSRSFPKYISKFEDLISPLVYFVSSGCAKLREQKSEAAQIGVYLRTNHFSKNKKQYSNYQIAALPFYTSCDFYAIKTAIDCLRAIYKEGFEYKKCGVYFFDLKEESDRPSNLFDTRNITKERTLFETFDAIKEKFGLHSMMIASALDCSWKPSYIRRSKEFTTNLDEVMRIT